MADTNESMANVSPGWHKVVYPVDPHSWFVGEVVGSHFHVWDAVHNGVSDRKLLGVAPDMHPIPVSHLMGRGAEFHPILAPIPGAQRNSREEGQ